MLSCSAVKNLNENEYLLEKNIILKDQEELLNNTPYLLLKGKPNKKIVGIPIQANIYNLSTPKSDSISKPKKYNNRLNNLLKNIGQAPVLLDSNVIKKMYLGLSSYIKIKVFLMQKLNLKLN